MTSRVAYSTDGKHSRGATCFIVEPLRRSEDDELCGFVLERDGAWDAHVVCGAVIGTHEAYERGIGPWDALAITYGYGDGESEARVAALTSISTASGDCVSTPARFMPASTDGPHSRRRERPSASIR